VPELPDVEGFRRVLAEHAVGSTIRRVDVLDSGVLRDVSPDRLRAELDGHRFGQPKRHGKWLITPVSGGGDRAMLLHFGMTGSLTWAGGEQDRHRHDRVVLVFPDGELRYRDMRKLQGLQFVADQDGARRVLGDLGPDALEVNVKRLREMLRKTRRQIKVALVDQSVIAGLGNLLVDEILWRAKINPFRRAADLDPVEIRRLHARMRTVLRQSLVEEQVPPKKSWLTGRRGEPSGSCPRCGSILSHGRVGGRGTVWCPCCQVAV
jgi:formamidopyrimidine-DNA glycosylase